MASASWAIAPPMASRDVTLVRSRSAPRPGASHPRRFPPRQRANRASPVVARPGATRARPRPRRAVATRAAAETAAALAASADHLHHVARAFLVQADAATTVASASASAEPTAFFSAFRPALDDPEQGFSIFRSAVRIAQSAMGLTSSGLDPGSLPTGGVVETFMEPGKVLSDAFRETRSEAALGSAIDDAEWTKVVNSVDVDLALLLLSVVTVVPLCKALNISPVLGFLGTGLLLNQEGIFSENQEVDQFCELGIQFLLFEMGLELSVQRLKALGKYAFGLGLNQVLFGNILFAAALLPPGHAIGTMILERVQSGAGVDELLQIESTLEAIVVGFGLTLSSSALGLQLLSDRGMMTTRLGTASLGVLLFQDLAVVPFIILLPLLQKLQSGGGDVAMDYGLMAAGTATSFLDLGVLSYAGYFAACWMYERVTALKCGNDVFVALSLLVLFGFSNATSAIGFSDSLGAFLAGLVLAGTPYAHDIIAELRAFKGLFLSLFFVTIGTTIDLPLAVELFPIVAVMTAGLMVGKIGVVTALGPITGLTWREALVAGAFLSQGGEFAFVIFGQATSGSSGSLFPQNLDELLVVVVISSMALTPLAVDLALKIAGPELDLSSCEDEPVDQLLTTVDEADGTFDSFDTGFKADAVEGSRDAEWIEGPEDRSAARVAYDIQRSYSEGEGSAGASEPTIVEDVDAR